MNIAIESTKFMIKVSNPLGKHVIVDKVCKKCPFMVKDHCFPANLMLLSFDEFDVVMGMDWLTLHEAIVNCRQKVMKLKCENGEILWVESDDADKLPMVISSMTAQNCMRKGYEAYLTYISSKRNLN